MIGLLAHNKKPAEGKNYHVQAAVGLEGGGGGVGMPVKGEAMPCRLLLMICSALLNAREAASGSLRACVDVHGKGIGG